MEGKEKVVRNRIRVRKRMRGREDRAGGGEEDSAKGKKGCANKRRNKAAGTKAGKRKDK